MDDDVGSFRFLGWLGGGVELDPDSPLFLGALAPDSTTAEASALFWATLYLFTVKENYVAVEFCFDALNVGRAMDAHFNAPEHHPLVGNLRMLTQGAEATMGPANLKMTHIRAHQGHPLNEMVNTLARWCTSSPTPQLPPLDLQWLFAEHRFALKWLWLSFRSDREPECIPPLADEALHIAPPTMQRAPEPELPWTFDYAWSDNEGKTFVPCCSFMTYNVRTLKDPSLTGQDHAPGRLQYLEAQLVDQNVHVVGLQETRCSRDYVHPSPYYHKFRVAAEHGQGGIEFWILRSSPLGLGHDGPVYPNLSEAVVVHAHSELLLVRIRLVGLHSWLVVVGHAPHKGHSESTKAMWWDSLDQLLRQHLGSSQPIILVDANASLGIPDGPGLGTLHATEEDYNGSRLRLLLEYYDMWLPCTFDGVHHGLHATWFSSASASPQGLRNDYIGLPTSWTSWTCSSMTCPDIDVAQHGMDHVAAMVCVKGTTSPRPTCRRSTQPRIDWHKMRACKDADTWDRIFDGLPQPSWDTDVHTHWQSCHSALMQRFARFFPKPRSCPRKPYITEEVWKLRTQKQALRRQLAIRAHMCPAVPLVAAFQTLKYQQPFRRTFLSGLLWYLAEGNTCDACHHVFLNEHRLYLHLRYSRSCFEQLRHRGLQVEPTPGRGSRHWNQQEQFTLCPYGLAFGPDLPPRPTDLPALAPHEMDLLIDLTSLEHLDFPDEDEINQLWLRIHAVLCRHPVAFEDMERALQCWRAFLAEEQPTHRRLRPWRFACILHAIDLALTRLDLEHLAPDLLPRQGPGAPLDDPQDRLKALSPAVFPSPGYGPKTTQAVFVHLDSGRRRQGDLQCAIEALQLDEAWPPIVISLDIVLNEEFGNILRPEARSFWLAQAARGALDGLMLGPPCETWTVSRERWFLDFIGPRPIRDNVCPWGLLIAEANQIFSSNSLMTFGLTMWWRMWRTGKFAALEHPGEPDPRDHPCAATIWRTPIGLFLRGLPQASLELVLQGYHGAISPKPTGLLLANSPADFASTERRMRSVARLPPALRMGQECGRWRTAQLKEYPEGFNRLIAELFRMWWMHAPSHTSPFLPSPSEAQIYNLFDSHVGQGEMGPDHAVGAARNYGIHPD
eukprot:Skav235421  [mRNA]  locus=scaffold924:310247:315996:- [translate_table: standard]